MTFFKKNNFTAKISKMSIFDLFLQKNNFFEITWNLEKEHGILGENLEFREKNSESRGITLNLEDKKR